jgi:hypothetical protein
MESIYVDHLSMNAYNRLTNEEAAEINDQTHHDINKAMGPGCGAKTAVATY